MPDITAQLAATVAEVVKSYAAKEMIAVIRRAEDAERRAMEAIQRAEDAEKKAAEALQFKAIPGPAGEPGKDGRDGLDGKDGVDGKDGRDGVDGKDGAPGRDGLDGASGADGLDGEDGEKGAPGIDGKDGRDGLDGKDADEGAIVERILPVVSKAADELIQKTIAAEVAKIPVPEDGKDGRDGVDGKDGSDGIQGKDGAPGIDGKDGRDGVDGKSITVDDMMPVLRSMQAEWALDFERRAHELLAKAIDKLPVPKDGRDGMSVQDFDITMDADERTLIVALKAADGKTIERRIKLTHVVGRGVWEAETQYSKGDAVTWDGSMWIAQEDSKGIKPSAYQKGAWKLSVKRGRDGK
jgi:hypothetical protein